MTTRECACTGIRFCGICRPATSAAKNDPSISRKNLLELFLCAECKCLFRIKRTKEATKEVETTTSSAKTSKPAAALVSCIDHRQDEGASAKTASCSPSIIFERCSDGFLSSSCGFVPFTGLALVPKFVSPEEEVQLLAVLDGASKKKEHHDEETRKVDDENNEERRNNQPSQPEADGITSAGAWVPSQSGRRKVDFGPRANFKLRKAQHRDTFRGFPLAWQSLVGRVDETTSALSCMPNDMASGDDDGSVEKNERATRATSSSSSSCLSPHECELSYRFGTNKGLKFPATNCEDASLFSCSCGSSSHYQHKRHEDDDNRAAFRTAEISALEYIPQVSSSLDPHMDDAWLWGARVVGVSLCSDSVMTFVQEKRTGRRVENEHEQMKQEDDDDDDDDDDDRRCDHSSSACCYEAVSIRVPLPRRAYFAMSDASRYHWLHGISSSDISSPRRISLTFRELSGGFVKENPVLAGEFAQIASRFL